MNTHKLSYLVTILILLLGTTINSQSKLGNITAITSQGEYNSPVWSPNGEKLLVTNHHNDALYIIHLKENKKIEKIKNGQGIGYQAHWSADGTNIIIREKSVGGTFSEAQTKSIDISTQKEKVVPTDYIYNSKIDLNNKSNSELFVYINQETLKLEAKKGVDGKPWVITKEDGQFYAPLVSPDQTKVIVHEGPTIYEYAIHGNQKRKNLGVGLASDWLPDSSGVFTFEDESEDGHDISASEIFMISESMLQKTQLTYSDDLAETWSKVSPNGKKIAFSDEKSGKIFIADLLLKN